MCSGATLCLSRCAHEASNIVNYPQDLLLEQHKAIKDRFDLGEVLIAPTNPNNVAADYGVAIQAANTVDGPLEWMQQDSQNKFKSGAKVATIVDAVCKLPCVTSRRLVVVYTKNDATEGANLIKKV